MTHGEKADTITQVPISIGSVRVAYDLNGHRVDMADELDE